jgi:hypothetical protein
MPVRGSPQEGAGEFPTEFETVAPAGYRGDHVAKGDIGEGLTHAAREVLRPIVRRLLAARIPFGQLEGRLRELFVEIAEEDFRLPDKPQTDSRVSLLTGINRKEVRRIRGRGEVAPEPSTFRRNQMASLIGRWTSDRRFRDESGKPRPLPYRAKRGPNFVELVKSVKTDLPPRAIVDELVRTGAVTVTDDVISLETDSYVPSLSSPDKLAMLADDPAEMVETMLGNIFADGEELLLQRKVSYDNVGADAVERIRAEIRREGERFLRRMNDVLARYDRDRNPKAPGGNRLSAGVGLYYFEKDSAQSRRPATAPRPRGRARKEESE